MKPATQLQTCEGREISDIKTLSYFQTIISSSALNPIWGAGISEVCETLQQGDSLFLPKGLCVFVFIYPAVCRIIFFKIDETFVELFFVAYNCI